MKRECAAILEGLKVRTHIQLVALARVMFLVDVRRLAVLF